MTTSQYLYRADPLRRLVLILLAFILGLIAIGLIGAMLLYVSKNGLLTRSYSLAVSFPDALGVEPGAAVKMAGVSIGTVDQVSIEGEQANLHLLIREDIPIPRGSRFVATPLLISQPGGVKVIPPTRQAQGPAPQMLSAGESRLTGESEEDVAASFSRMNALVEQMTRVGHKTAVLLEETTRTAHRFDAVVGSGPGPGDLRQTLTGVRIASQSGARAMQELSLLLSQTQSNSRVLLRNLTDMTTQLDSLTRTGRPHLAGILTDIHQTAATVSHAAGQGNELLQKGNRLLQNSENVKRLSGAVTDLSDTMANLKNASEKMNAIAGNVRDLSGDPEPARDVKGILHNLRSTSDKLDRTAANNQRLLADPNLPGDLQEILRNIKQLTEVSNKLLETLSKTAAKKH